MAFGDMCSELRGSVPKIPFSFTRTLINRAYRVIREQHLWSFNIFTSAWVTPPLVTAGTVTTVQGSASITFDATATAALNAASTLVSLITQRQFRIAVGGLYNLIAFNSGTGVATLDRIYADPSGTGQAYQIYQAYYTAPMKDFLTWLTVRNPTLFLSLDLTQTRTQIDQRDPQRTTYQWPTCVVPFGLDLRGAGTATPSATLNYPMFELWGQPVAPYVYQCYGLRKGTDLVAPTDPLPPAIGEDLVLARARAYAYEWAEANKDMSPRSSGPDFKFLIGATMAEYTRLLTMYRRQDKEIIDNYYSIHGLSGVPGQWGQYSTIAGVASPYTPL